MGGVTGGSAKKAFNDIPGIAPYATALSTSTFDVTGVSAEVYFFALGNTSEGDGGGGLYVYKPSSTATPVNYSVIASNTGTGRWLLTIGSGGTGSGLVVANRAALRALATNLTPNTLVTELGYSSNGDGGGGIWVVQRSNSTAIDNDGTIVVTGGSYGTTSTDQCFFRLGSPTSTPHNSVRMNVRWFGAVQGTGGDCGTAVTHAFTALGANFGYFPGGQLYFPAGTYMFTQMLQLDAGNYKVDITGDGGSTEFAFGFSGSTNVTTNYCMIQLSHFGTGSEISHFGLSNRPIIANANLPASILRFTNCGGINVHHISGANMMTMGTTGGGGGITYIPANPMPQTEGGVVYFDGGLDNLCSDLIILGSFGTVLCVSGNADVDVRHCHFSQTNVAITGVFDNSVVGVRPTVWYYHADSCSFSDTFVDGGGPGRSFQGCTITGGTGTWGITTATPHNMVAGDWIVINGATGNTGYNGKWRVHSVPTGLGGEFHLNISGTMAGNETGVYVTSPFAACQFGGAVGVAGGFTEGTISNIFTNQGAPFNLIGAVSLFLNAKMDGGTGDQNYISGVQVSNIYADFGETVLFILGEPISGYSAFAIQCNNIRANGGPRSPWGMIHIEVAGQVQITDPYAEAALTAYQGASVTPNPGTGNWLFTPLTAVAIDDGGADNATIYGCTDIAVLGGILQSVSSYNGPTYTSVGVSVSGTRITNINLKGSQVDCISAYSTPLLLLNGATRIVTSGTDIIEAISCDFRNGHGASAYASTATSCAPGDTFLPFQTPTLNQDKIWASGSPTVMTLPSGVCKARVTANIVWAAWPGANSSTLVRIQRNPAAGGAAYVAGTSIANGPYQNLDSGVMFVTPGDTFQLVVSNGTGGTVNVGGDQQTKLTVEIVS